ncbi:hypothetical protein Tco_0413388 [Tanacetum coccineum]
MGLIELKKPIWVNHESWNGSVWESGLLGLKVGFFLRVLLLRPFDWDMMIRVHDVRDEEGCCDVVAIGGAMSLGVFEKGPRDLASPSMRGCDLYLPHPDGFAWDDEERIIGAVIASEKKFFQQNLNWFGLEIRRVEVRERICCLLVVYAPSNGLKKNKYLGYSSFRGRISGTGMYYHAVDFNEVRVKSERWELIFNPHSAKDLILFFLESGLVEVNRCDVALYWCHRIRTMMSKLDQISSWFGECY